MRPNECVTEGWATNKCLHKVVKTPASDCPSLAIALAESGMQKFPGYADGLRIVEYLHSRYLGSPSWGEDETEWCSASENLVHQKGWYEGANSV